jgi:hypothetical protein
MSGTCQTAGDSSLPFSVQAPLRRFALPRPSFLLFFRLVSFAHPLNNKVTFENPSMERLRIN